MAGLHLNIGLFDIDYDKLQVGLVSGAAFCVGNGASVRTPGLEMDSMLMLSENHLVTFFGGLYES